MPDRVVLFLDAQNVYSRLICSRGPGGHARVLHEVRVYTGRPDATRQPKAYAAHMRQCAAWQRAGASVVARTLRYPHDWLASKAEEKGIDVAPAIDFVAGAIDGAYDVGIIFSTDSDLRPALEYVLQKFKGRPRVEVAAWRSPTARGSLAVRGPQRVWCHYLDWNDYLSVHDPRDYNLRS